MDSILFLAADPTEEARLNLQREIREIDEKLSRTKQKKRFRLAQKWAVRAPDITQSLLEIQPQIVHFSGHGLSNGALCIEDAKGNVQPVSTEALANLFRLFEGKIECVVLNACNSEAMAEAIAKYVPFVIGMSDTLADEAAIAFSTGFYQALSAGQSIEKAFEFGRAQVLMQGQTEALAPILVRKGISTEPTAPRGPLPAAPSIERPLRPFGEVDCETEVAILKEHYKEYYFAETPFSELALHPSTYLIIGRRGSGKTALTHYFRFQNSLPRALAICLNAAEAFHTIIAQIYDATQLSEIAVPRLTATWERLLWDTIFEHLRDRDPLIAEAYRLGRTNGSNHARLAHEPTFQGYGGDWGPARTIREVPGAEPNSLFEQAKEAVFAITRRTPIILAIDTLENFDVHDQVMALGISSLIECASNFDRLYQSKRIYLKLFLMSEVFPHLKEEVILNPLKSIRNEIYMHWRPKDLIRMISWRFYQYLKVNKLLNRRQLQIQWSSYRDVHGHLWLPFFGESVVNRQGVREETFPYVLRHTQMRPRQLIELCDTIAREAQRSSTFPRFSSEQLVRGIAEAEEDLADEVINSYSRVYPKVGRILDALKEMPILFTGNELDKVAPKTASEWPATRYSPFNFRQLVSELGIVGRVRHYDSRTNQAAVDFEYASRGRLSLLSTDECAIHPMFFRRLRINTKSKVTIFPFPDHPDYEELQP
jgi:hypothetical protein